MCLVYRSALDIHCSLPLQASTIMFVKLSIKSISKTYLAFYQTLSGLNFVLQLEH